MRQTTEHCLLKKWNSHDRLYRRIESFGREVTIVLYHFLLDQKVIKKSRLSELVLKHRQPSTTDEKKTVAFTPNCSGTSAFHPQSAPNLSCLLRLIQNAKYFLRILA